MKRLQVLRQQDSQVLFGQAWATQNAWERLCGLLPRRELAQDQALWIAPCQSIHTLFMRFAIDVAFLDRSQRIVKVAHYRPWRPWGGAWKTRSVLEMPAGSIERWNLKAGLQLELRHEN